jgi:hypothetical protein
MALLLKKNVLFGDVSLSFIEGTTGTYRINLTGLSNSAIDTGLNFNKAFKASASIPTEVQNKLGTFNADKSSFTTSLTKLLPTTDTTLPYIVKALTPMAEALFKQVNFSVSDLSVTTVDGNTVVSGLLGNGHKLTFTVGSQLLAMDYSVSNPIDLETIFPTAPVIKDFVFNNLQFVLTNQAFAVTNPKLGEISVSKGFNFIGTIDFSKINNGVANTLSQDLSIHTLSVQMNVDPNTGLALKAAISSKLTLVSVDDFKATMSNADLDLTVDSKSKFSGKLTGDIELTGYDWTCLLYTTYS